MESYLPPRPLKVIAPLMKPLERKLEVQYPLIVLTGHSSYNFTGFSVDSRQGFFQIFWIVSVLTPTRYTVVYYVPPTVHFTFSLKKKSTTKKIAQSDYNPRHKRPCSMVLARYGILRKRPNVP